MAAELSASAARATPALLGGGAQRWENAAARGDRSMWLGRRDEEAAGHTHVVALMRVMDSLRKTLQAAGFQVYTHLCPPTHAGAARLSEEVHLYSDKDETVNSIWAISESGLEAVEDDDRVSAIVSAETVALLLEAHRTHMNSPQILTKPSVYRLPS